MQQWLEFNGAGEVGVVADAPPHEAPPNAWTSAQNIRFRDGSAVSFPGHDVGSDNTNVDDVLAIMPVSSNTQHYWAHATLSGATPKLYAFDGTTQHDISPSVALTNTRSDIFTWAFLNQNLVFNNGVDQPHSWALDTGTPAAILTGWNSNCRAGSIFAHRGFLIALDITDTGTRRPFRVKWSDEAAAGGLPTSWDITDATKQAGEFDLGDAVGSTLLAGLGLREQAMLYTERDAIAMQYIGGDLIWSFRPISRAAGVLSRRAVGAFRGNHIYVTDQDVVMTDGQTVRSIIDRRNRRFLFNQLDESNYGFTQVQVHRLLNEVWIAFPGQGSTYNNLALVWNVNDNTWGVRDLPAGCISLADGIDITGLSTETWTSSANNWDVETQSWDERSFNIVGGQLLLGGDDSGAGVTGGPIFRAEKTNQFDGVNRTSRIERLGLRVPNGERKMTITELWPRATGGVFKVYVGTQDDPNGPVTWQVEKDFDPEQDRKVTFRMTGRYPCVAFESNTDVDWALQGFSMKYREGARR
tara:strand:+ start:4525 stop:6102 length:1578 start_codon:yes stop_codon:yes gene_type:complete